MLTRCLCSLELQHYQVYHGCEAVAVDARSAIGVDIASDAHRGSNCRGAEDVAHVCEKEQSAASFEGDGIIVRCGA